MDESSLSRSKNTVFPLDSVFKLLKRGGLNVSSGPRHRNFSDFYFIQVFEWDRLWPSIQTRIESILIRFRPTLWLVLGSIDYVVNTWPHICTGSLWSLTLRESSYLRAKVLRSVNLPTLHETTLSSVRARTWCDLVIIVIKDNVSLRHLLILNCSHALSVWLSAKSLLLRSDAWHGN